MKTPRGILVIAGCTVAYTPVVQAYISYAKENTFQVDVIQYTNFKRLSFITFALIKGLQGRYEKVICVNNQSLPVLFILSWLSSSQVVYWKLESYKIFENFSLVSILQLFEYLLPRTIVPLIVPTTFRAELQKPKFKVTSILPNAPIRPFISDAIVRKLSLNNIKLVLYGNISSPKGIYLNEWIDYCEKSNNCHFTIIGKVSQNTPKVSWQDKINHDLLIKGLCDEEKFNFSIVGYREINQNTLYAAPNKLLESLSCGLPIIGHIGNPYVANLIEQYQCGILIDFNNLDSFVFDLTSDQYVSMSTNAFQASSDMCLSACVYNTPLWFE